ncbi:MAG: hypothetical protein KBT69_01835 [Oceanihabitans sp.]|nr:hypothetical protein [Oceanihabitans sp.]
MSRIFAVNRADFLKDFSIVFIIVISPFLFFLYMLSPEKTGEWETWLFHININNTGYEVDEFLWCISTYFLITINLSLWFVSCKHWWRYVILIPIIIELEKINLIYYDLSYDILDYKFHYSFILSIPIIIFLFVLSKKLNYYSLSKSINKQIDDEINVLMKHVSNYKTEDYKKYKKKLVLLRKQKINLDKKEYLIKLIKLRDDFALNPENK